MGFGPSSAGPTNAGLWPQAECDGVESRGYVHSEAVSPWKSVLCCRGSGGGSKLSKRAVICGETLKDIGVLDFLRSKQSDRSNLIEYQTTARFRQSVLHGTRSFKVWTGSIYFNL